VEENLYFAKTQSTSVSDFWLPYTSEM